jgi:hypothetical protein
MFNTIKTANGSKTSLARIVTRRDFLVFVAGLEVRVVGPLVRGFVGHDVDGLIGGNDGLSVHLSDKRSVQSVI